ncbi:NAD(P)-binding protein [Geobacter sp. DSM 9736]|uniref:NAD(P)-binding protein n=1 Tax=Geobacter sp. DSM 9736 TaxID=1277350 RepID=UPI000B50B68A|nr:NAD(P)-binding protein [Geobacter sp. DSM 9736]SNB47504.1 UDP-galactopyranose mutase [Geobacter sp. DSM 9736]
MTQTLIVFSHLRWNFVYQRPQHLLTRMARSRQVIFFEEPVFSEKVEPFLEESVPEPNVTVCRPHTPSSKSGYHDEQLTYLAPLLKKLIRDKGLTDYSVWFYTPMALPLAQNLSPQAIVYDCMDELSAFKGAPRQVVQRESALLKVADVVFTGGPSLYRAKRDHHPEVHCFPSSVDAGHFSRAKDMTLEHEAQKGLPRPRLGYFGVIDERLDLNLIDAMAAAHPEWQIVMVGPVVKIDPATLPRHPNIHYFGQREYADLPSFLSGWDVCLIPFAINESTRFISPTKTLEYMAAEKPVVSTPITDVAEPYGDIVFIGHSHDAFISFCRDALALSQAQYDQRIAGMRKVLASTSWDATARGMNELLDRVLEEGGKVSEKRVRAEVSQRVPGKLPHLVVGAGPTGLSAAYHLGENALLIEQHGKVGGWCRSIEEKGFTFDYAGHIMFSNDPYVHRMYEMLLGENVHWQEREAWIHSKGVYTRYPFQGALYGLPPEVIKECIVGAIESRYGKIGKEAPPGGEAGDHHILPLTHRREEPKNFEEFIYRVWGAGIAKHFAIPYNRKLWGLPLTEMETSWLGGRVPLPDLDEMIEGALHPVPKPMGPNARFGYPLHGGFQSLMDGFLPHLQGRVKTGSPVIKVSPRLKTVTVRGGTEYCYETLISTMPLPELIRMIGDEAPPKVHLAAAKLRYLSIRNVNLGIARPDVTEKHWIYLPETPVSHRIFVQGNASPHCNPPGGFGLTLEISYSDLKPLPCEGEELIKRCIGDMRKIGMLRPRDKVITANELDMPYAYVIYDHTRSENVAVIRSWLEEHGIFPSGRYGEWEYYNSDHALLAGRKAAEKALQYAADTASEKPERRRVQRRT